MTQVMGVRHEDVQPEDWAISLETPTTMAQVDQVHPDQPWVKLDMLHHKTPWIPAEGWIFVRLHEF